MRRTLAPLLMPVPVLTEVGYLAGLPGAAGLGGG
jgi:hypothetical protein